MKAIRVVTIVCWVIVAAALLGLAGWFLTGTMFGASSTWMDRNMPFRVNIGGFESLSGPFNVVGEYSASPAGVNTIQVNWVSGEITVIAHDGDMIEITERAQRDLRDDERMYVSVSGGTVEIRFLDRRGPNMNMRMPQKRLEVRVPAALSEDLSILGVGSTSGRVNIDGITATTLDVGTTSGAVNVSNITSRNVDINALSGRIAVTYAVADSMVLDSTSGAVNVSDVNVRELEIDTLSGSISVTDSVAVDINLDSTSGRISATGTFDNIRGNSLSGSINIDSAAVSSVVDARSTSGSVTLRGALANVNVGTLSGSITIHSAIAPERVNANSTSGRMSITVPNDGYISVNHSSTSGRFNSEIPVLMQGAEPRFTLSTLSGNVNIYQLQ